MRLLQLDILVRYCDFPSPLARNEVFGPWRALFTSKQATVLPYQYSTCSIIE